MTGSTAHPPTTRHPLAVGAWLVALTLLLISCGTSSSTTTTPAPTPSSTSSTSPTASVPSGGEAAEAMLLLSELPRLTLEPDPTRLAATVGSDTAFAFDLFGEIRGDENLMVSPYSVSSALTMAFAGAAGTTAEEMASALHLTGEPAEVHRGRALLDDALAEQPDTGEDQAFALEVANSVWGQAGYGFRPEYLDTLASNYGAGMYVVDYLADPDGARVAINDWVEDATAERIKDLIPAGSIDEDTRLVLANAIWFKAAWLSPFDPAATVDGPFTLLGGEEVTVPVMHRSDMLRTTTGDGWVAVELPYVGDASMLVIVPDSGRFTQVAEDFDVDDLVRLSENLSTAQVMLAMPKFTYETEANLVGPLEALGMRTAFLPSGPGGADFSALSQPPELSITDVVHKSFIAVDEEGTEAAAATGVIMGVTAIPEVVELTIDRPFLYLIQHTSSGEILFLGQVTDPR